MQVWIPFSPVQHVDCGCLVPERNGPRRRHRDTARPSTVCRPPSLDACARFGFRVYALPADELFPFLIDFAFS